MTDHHEFVGLWQDGVPKLGVTKVRCINHGSFASVRKRAVRQVYRLQAGAPRGFYRLPKRVDVGEVNDSCDLQGT
jgi:hypothetical protein